MENNNKESFNLLDMSGSCSESGSEIRGFVHPPKKKKIKRRLRGSQVRNNSDDEAHRGDKHLCIVCEIGRTVSIWLSIGLLVLWLLLLAWLGLRLHGQISRLNTDVEQVVAGSKGVPDALQKCHSMSKELQHNQTLLLAQLMTLTSQVTNFSIKVTEVHHGLSEVEGRLKGAPELVKVPHEIADLYGSVGKLGSSVGGLEASVVTLKASSISLRNESDILRQEVANLKESVQQISNASASAGSGSNGGNTSLSSKEDDLEKLVVELKKELTELSANVSRLNDTIVKKLNLNSEELSEQQKIMDMLMNVSTRVSTLEGSCASISDQKEITNEVYQISSQANQTLSRIAIAESKIDLLSRKVDDQVNLFLTKSNIREEPSVLSTSSTTLIGENAVDTTVAGSSLNKPVSSNTGKILNTTDAPQNHSAVTESTSGRVASNENPA